jgi:hypothetical protein
LSFCFHDRQLLAGWFIAAPLIDSRSTLGATSNNRCSECSGGRLEREEECHCTCLQRVHIITKGRKRMIAATVETLKRYSCASKAKAA